MRSAAVISLVFLAAFAAITWWALESSGVATLQTRRPDGALRSTHVWYAENGPSIWIEAATDGRAFLSDIRRDPKVTVSIEGRETPYTAEVLADPSAHSRIRELLRAKYGFRDWWVSLLQDTSGSVVVQLSPSREGGSS